MIPDDLKCSTYKSFQIKNLHGENSLRFLEQLMPAKLENMMVLRVVMGEDFGRPLAERFLSHVRMVLSELDVKTED